MVVEVVIVVVVVGVVVVPAVLAAEEEEVVVGVVVVIVVVVVGFLSLAWHADDSTARTKGPLLTKEPTSHHKTTNKIQQIKNKNNSDKSAPSVLLYSTFVAYSGTVVTVL